VIGLSPLFHRLTACFLYNSTVCVPRFTQQVLLPLVSAKEKPQRLHLSLPSPTPPKVWMSEAEVEGWSNACYCTDVLRRGKQLCLVLERLADDSSSDVRVKDSISTTHTTHYLFLHMVRALRCTVFSLPWLTLSPSLRHCSLSPSCLLFSATAGNDGQPYLAWTSHGLGS
jgi:hypothetical protein